MHVASGPRWPKTWQVKLPTMLQICFECKHACPAITPTQDGATSTTGSISKAGTAVTPSTTNKVSRRCQQAAHRGLSQGRRPGAGRGRPGKMAAQVPLACQYLKGIYRKDEAKLLTRAGSDRIRGNGFKLKDSRLTLDIKNKFLLWGWWGTVTGCPERLWMPHPQQRSRPRWMQLWATCSSWRRPFLQQGGWNWIIFEIPFQPRPF